MTESKTRDVLAELRRPFTPQAVRFKLQSGGKNEQQGGLVVCYIDARLVIERLNTICGLDWQDAYVDAVGAPGSLCCLLTVGGHTRSDVGSSDAAAGGSMQGVKAKALYSDAFKRAAVKFGVGVSLYATPRMWADPADLKFSGGKASGIKPAAEKKFRAQYANWLTQLGVQAFGEPLDHGDADDAAGDHELDAEPSVSVVQAPAAAAPTSEAPEGSGPLTAEQAKHVYALAEQRGWLTKANKIDFAMLGKALRPITGSNMVKEARQEHYAEIVKALEDGSAVANAAEAHPAVEGSPDPQVEQPGGIPVVAPGDPGFEVISPTQVAALKLECREIVEGGQTDSASIIGVIQEEAGTRILEEITPVALKKIQDRFLDLLWTPPF